MTVLAAAGVADAPGTLSFLVIFGMAVILFFLFRSMSRHLRKVSGRPAGRPKSGPGGALGPAAAEDHSRAAAPSGEAAGPPGGQGAGT